MEEAVHEEQQYLDLVRRCIEHGRRKGNRTGTDTVGQFGAMMRFTLRDHFPLLTTKRVFWRGVLEELLWFLRGDTNGNNLAERGVHIWDAHGTREFLDKRGLLEREQGDLGPVYGFQWRHFGAPYTDMYADYSGRGVDQLKECERLIREEPQSRRIVMTAWNPCDLAQMALPPCHLLCQFEVCDNELNCMMVQRSCDMGLGVPFNIASYALLTRLMAHSCGLKAGEFVYMMGDVHVYCDHVDALQQQLERQPVAFPQLLIKCDPKPIEQYTAEDVELVDYHPHAALKMALAV